MDDWTNPYKNLSLLIKTLSVDDRGDIIDLLHGPDEEDEGRMIHKRKNRTHDGVGKVKNILKRGHRKRTYAVSTFLHLLLFIRACGSLRSYKGLTHNLLSGQPVHSVISVSPLPFLSCVQELSTRSTMSRMYSRKGLSEIRTDQNVLKEGK